MLMFIRGKGKEKYRTSEGVQPLADDPKFDIWYAENWMVMSWLVNTMNLEISEEFLLAKSAKEVWDIVRHSYSAIENTAALFQLKGMIKDLKLDLCVVQYHSTLQKLWQQIDLYDAQEWSCPQDQILYKKLVDRERTYEFLLGLHPRFEEVRVRIMGTRPLPTLREAFNTVKFEESRKCLTQGPTITSESSALVAKGAASESKGKKPAKGWCDHCNRNGHTRDTYWKIHGKPPNNKGK